MTNQTELMFNNEMGMPTGLWINYKTGDSINVRDVFFEDGQMQLQLTDGRVVSGSILSDYVQGGTAADIESIKNNKKQAPKKPASTARTVNSPLEDIVIPTLDVYDVPITAPSPTNSNKDIINKTLDKALKNNLLTININENNLPKTEIKFLINTLDIPLDEISEEIIKRAIDIDVLKKDLSKKINSIFNKTKK